jgi:anti-sigma B factor antagonist
VNQLAYADPLALTPCRTGDGVVRLPVSDEIDIYAAPRLREAIEEILADPATTCLTVDLAQLDYIDCTGVTVLIAGRQLAERHGIRFTVVNPRGPVRRVFRVLSLEHLLETEPRRRC